MPPANPDPTGRFSNRAGNYAKYRPTYPAALIGFLEGLIGSRRGNQVADIGSGTGILTELLLLKGLHVTAVEPNAAMREEAERRLGGYERFYSQDGRSEATGLVDQSVDLITVAQAFHWMEAAATHTEFLRILRPGGHMVLVWNIRLVNTPFLKAYEELIRAFARQYEVANRIDPVAIGTLFQGFDRQQRVFSNDRLMDFEGLKGLVLSASYMPLETDPAFAELARRLEELFARYNENGLVRMEYETKVFYNP